MQSDTIDHPHMDADATVRRTEEAEHCYERGDYVAARACYEQALGAWLALRGTDDLDMARVQRGLGVTLLELSDYVAAQALLEQALATRERTLGAEHPDTAQCLTDLGAARFLQGDITSAHTLTQRALALREQTLGSDHPDTIESLNNLGVIVNRQDERGRSIQIHKLALERSSAR